MGVKLLIRPVPPKGVTGPTSYDLLKRLIDELCVSQPSGRSEAWSVTCQLMKQGHGLVGTVGGPTAGAGGGGGLRDTWAVTFRDAPDVVFLLQRPECKVLECESAVMRLLEKKLEFAKQMAVRVEGHTYTKGDFVLRLCTATQAIHSTQALLGYCLEVEYLPVSSMSSAEGMLGELLDLMKQLMNTIVAAAAAANTTTTQEGQGPAGGGGGAGALSQTLHNNNNSSNSNNSLNRHRSNRKRY
ncbi:hypothetical protein VOLCADRAFT_95836 [Volvox carteri f. nagariensis]|uniref:Mediator of RNA polymerase II transcription subunit 20 n=1 Tax=Volvox carteri f. nagariensis TaxID=3068 RepID=D8U8I1_VOLCA|nr:uncharacterized protein VOLCADRAFT_95836 [Volvox carteri f. nagariensis]EFJ43928.1 hypothetical protein VOLCADRAFT_95836 [Volvox carteri f. nagariensis]|eukprot:XP_002954940.1 hypothetical protein VOLCADRAFT_95836 [Volvox carteri f. nagariensis]